MLAARNEVQKGCETYDYLIINDRLDDAFRQLEMHRDRRAVPEGAGRPERAQAPTDLNHWVIWLFWKSSAGS